MGSAKTALGMGHAGEWRHDHCGKAGETGRARVEDAPDATRDRGRPLGIGVRIVGPRASLRPERAGQTGDRILPDAQLPAPSVEVFTRHVDWAPGAARREPEPTKSARDAGNGGRGEFDPHWTSADGTARTRCERTDSETWTGVTSRDSSVGTEPIWPQVIPRTRATIIGRVSTPSRSPDRGDGSPGPRSPAGPRSATR